MLPELWAASGPGEAVGHDPAAGPAGRRSACAVALAQTTLVLPDPGLSAQVVHRAGRPGAGPFTADHPVAADCRAAVADGGRTIMQAARDHGIS